MMLSRFFRRVAVCSLAGVLVTSVVSAQEAGDERPKGEKQDGGRREGGRPEGGQEGGRGRGGFGGGFGGGRTGGPGGLFQIDRARLLEVEKVRQELKIEEAQAATIDAALEAYREQRASSGSTLDRDAIGRMTEEERTAAFAKMQKEREELSKQTDEVLNALLEEAQKTRLDQIVVQIRLATGTFATLKADDMKAKLSLTEEQITKLTDAETKMNEERTAAMQEIAATRDFQKMGEKMVEFQKKGLESAMGLLTDDQKKTVTDLSGPEFKFELRDLMGRGRGGPGGGPGGPGGGPGGPGGGRGQGRGERPKAE